MSNLVQPTLSTVDHHEVSAPLGLDALGLSSLIALGVALGALALRIPYLTLVPLFTDETREALYALPIMRGESFPLTHYNTYIGVIHPYLLAALYRVVGLNPAVPRAIAAVFGALLAGLVVLLAWQFAARDPRLARSGSHAPAIVAALLAGGLVATSFPLIAINSHLGWSNCLTPFFTTLALGATWLALVTKRPAWLLVGGFVWGLALQTHPTAIAVLPGVLVWFLLHPTGRAWLRTRWPWLAVAAFALGYANLIWYNLTNQGHSLTEALAAGNAYRTPPTPAERLAVIQVVVSQLARMLAGSYTIQPDGGFPPQTSPLVFLYGGVALLALLWAARRIDTAILPLAVASGAVTLPLVTGAFQEFYSTRYMAPILPLVYLALALAVTSVWNAWRARTGDGRSVLADVGLVVVGIILIGLPLAPLTQLYADSQAYEVTNAPFIEMAAAAQAAAGDGAIVLVDSDTSRRSLRGGGNGRRVMEYLLTMDATDFKILRRDAIRWFLENSDAPLFLILSDDTYTEFASQYSLTPTGLDGSGLAAYTASGRQ